MRDKENAKIVSLKLNSNIFKKTYLHEVSYKLPVDHVLVLEWILWHLLEVFWQVLQVPSMLFDFTNLNPFDRVCLQHASNQVFAVWWYVRSHLVVAKLDFVEKLSEIIVIEG